jgi:hypothetical protein
MTACGVPYADYRSHVPYVVWHGLAAALKCTFCRLVRAEANPCHPACNQVTHEPPRPLVRRP